MWKSGSPITALLGLRHGHTPKGPTSALCHLDVAVFAQNLLDKRYQGIGSAGLSNQGPLPVLRGYRRNGATCNEDERSAYGVQDSRYREHQFTAKVHVQQGEVHLVAGEHPLCCL